MHTRSYKDTIHIIIKGKHHMRPKTLRILQAARFRIGCNCVIPLKVFHRHRIRTLPVPRPHLPSKNSPISVQCCESDNLHIIQLIPPLTRKQTQCTIASSFSWMWRKVGGIRFAKLSEAQIGSQRSDQSVQLCRCIFG